MKFGIWYKSFVKDLRVTNRMLSKYIYPKQLPNLKLKYYKKYIKNPYMYHTFKQDKTQIINLNKSVENPTYLPNQILAKYG